MHKVTLSAKVIFFQVDDCFHMFKVGGLNAFIILFPACCGLTNDDAQLLLQIYSNDRLALIDQTFILISGEHEKEKTKLVKIGNVC